MNKDINVRVTGPDKEKKVEVEVTVPIYDAGRKVPRIKFRTSDVLKYMETLHTPKTKGTLKLVEEGYIDNEPPDHVVNSTWVFKMEIASKPKKAPKAARTRTPKVKKREV
tara:strand:+ start:1156 stop:1485 length:330 start_codon:yes stop_codon:yes gene_type:complete